MAEVRTDDVVAVEELRATRLTLVDRAGAIRATLGPSGDDAIGLRLYDGQQRARAELALDERGGTNLKLCDAHGEVSSWLAVGRHGDPSLYLCGRSRRRRVRGHAKLSVDEHGCPVLSLHDRTGQPRALLSLDERTGMASLSYADARGNLSVMLTEDVGDGPLHDFARRPDPAIPALPLGPERAKPEAVTEEVTAAEVPAAEPDAPDPAVSILTARLAELESVLEDFLRRPEPTVAPALSVPDDVADDPRIAMLTAGLARLERARRRHWISATALLLFGALCGGVTTRMAASPATPVAGEAVAPVATAHRSEPILRAEEILLTDQSGTTRARLGVLPDGTPLLWMTDPKSRTTIELSALTGQGAVLRLGGGKSSIALVAPPEDLPSLGAYDGSEVLFQAPSHVARFLPPDLWP
ncbi:MAG TPA: hypothetical protein VKA21_11905 [Candidatus Binatia bacterium]|nr:hypothetical protein [Candidatus Binatia bacterium]